MTKNSRILVAVGVLVVAAAYVLAPHAVNAAQPAYQGQVQRIEHLGLRVDTNGCVRIDWTTAKDVGVWLSGEPDASFSPGPDAAVWQTGGDATVWVAPDASLGPRSLPATGLSYICTSRNNASCWKQGGAIDSCQYASFLPADQPTAPFSFMPEPDGGRAKVWGVSTAGTANVECCAVIPAVLNGN
jgi:hypothetical protein